MLRDLTEADGLALEALCEACAAFTEEITGLPPGPAEAQSIFLAIAPHGDYARKRLWGLFDGDRLVGVMDGAFGHPSEDAFWIALLMLAPEARGAGRGRMVVEAVEAHARQFGAGRLALAVKQDYALGQAFWQRLGYRKFDERVLDMAGHGPCLFDCLEKSLAPG